MVDAGTQEVLGHGLALPDGDGGTVVLTCFHVAAACAPQKLTVAFADPGGHLEEPVRAFFDDDRCDPSTDVATLRVDRPPPAPPLLHRLEPDEYDATLEHRVTGLTWMQPSTLDGMLGPASALEVQDGPGETYRLDRVFTLRQASDSRPGVSGAPACLQAGVLGLAHFARNESPDEGRELYVVPLDAWVRIWPALAHRLEPMIDRKLLDAARVVRASELAAGLATNVADPDLTIASYRPDVYVPHPAAQDAADMLERHRQVLVLGRPMAGKTRLALELAGLHEGSWVVLPEAVVPPESFERAGLARQRLVLLVDDLHHRGSRPDILRWRRKLEESGADVLVIATSRDDEDFIAVKQDDPRTAHRMAEFAVRLSADQRGGADFPVQDAFRLGDLLGLSPELIDTRFDGTPGSLTLDVALMRERYERLRDTDVGGVSAGRLLESLRLLLLCGHDTLAERWARDVAEHVRGSGPIANETWDALRRKTESSGFGVFVDGAFKTYLPLLEQAVAFTPSDDDFRLVAERLVTAAEWDKVIAFASASVPAAVRRAALDQVPGSTDGGADERVVQMLRAVALHDLDEREAAIAELERVRGGPDMTRRDDAARMLGAYLEEWDRPDEAITVWRSAVRSSRPDIASEVQARLGLLLLSQGRYDDADPLLRAAAVSDNAEVNAVAAYNLATSEAPLGAEDRTSLLLRATELGDRRASPAAAIRLATAGPVSVLPGIVRTVLEEEAGASGQHADLAAVLLALSADGDEPLDDELVPLRRAAMRKPPSEFTAMASALLGQALGKRGRHEEAVVHFERARSLNESTGTPFHHWEALGVAYGELGRLDEAYDTLMEGLGDEEEPGSITYNLGVMEVRRSRLPSAKEHLTRAAGSPEPAVAARAVAALAQLRMTDGCDEDHTNHDVIEALSGLADHATDDDELSSLQYGLAQALARAGRTDDAIAAFEIAIRADQSWAFGAKMEFAALLFQTGQEERAEALLAEAAEAGDGHAAYLLAQTRLEAGDAVAALPFLRQGARSADRSVSDASRWRLAMELPNAGSWREALGRHQQLLDEAENARVASGVRHSMALVLAEREEWAEAAELWREIGESPDVLEMIRWRYWLGHSYLKLDRYGEARETLLAEMADPDSELRLASAQELANAALEQDDIATARLTLGFVINAGDDGDAQRADLMLGVLEHKEGDEQAAKRLWKRAAAGVEVEAAAAALVNLAETAEEHGDWDTAAAQLRRAADLDPPDLGIEVLTRLAMGELRRDRLDAAAGPVQALAQRDVEAAGQMVLELAHGLVERGRLDEAGRHLKLIRQATDSAVRLQALMLYGQIYDRKGDLGAARAWFDRAAAIDDPRRFGAFAGATAALELGDDAGALARFRIATDSVLASIADEAWLRVGERLLDNGQLDEAKVALANASRSADAEVARAAQQHLLEVATEQDDVDTVTSLGAELTSTGPPADQAEAAVMVGLFWIQRGSAKEAEAALTRAVSSGVEPWDAAAAINLSALLSDRFERARSLLLPFAAKSGPMRGRVRFALAELLAVHGQLDEAVELLEQVLLEADDELAGMSSLTMARVHARADRFDLAAAALEHPAAQAHPAFAPTVVGLLSQATDQIMATYGLPLLRAAVRVADDDLRPALQIAVAQRLLEGDPAAVPDLLEPLVHRPEHRFAALNLLGHACEQLGHLEQAAAHWDAAFAAAPDEGATAAWYGGLAYYDLGQSADAERLWSQITEVADDTLAGGALLNLGVMLAETDPARAARLWTAAVARGNREADDYLEVLRDILLG